MKQEFTYFVWPVRQLVSSICGSGLNQEPLLFITCPEISAVTQRGAAFRFLRGGCRDTDAGRHWLGPRDFIAMSGLIEEVMTIPRFFPARFRHALFPPKTGCTTC